MSKCRTEYITKEQAINVVNVAFGHVYDSDSTTVCLVDLQNEIIMTIEQNTEPADVVEVTRCEDCVKNKKCMLYSDYRFPFFENDFCSYGWDGEE